MEEIGSKLLVLKYRYPSILTGDGRVQAVGNMDGNTPVIDLPVGTLIQFGDQFVTLSSDSFTNTSLNSPSGYDRHQQYQHSLFAGLSDFAATNNSNGNTIRVSTLPQRSNGLYLNRDGSLVFQNLSQHQVTPLNVLLLRSKPKGNLATGIVKLY